MYDQIVYHLVSLIWCFCEIKRENIGKVYLLKVENIIQSIYVIIYVYIPCLQIDGES